MSEENKEIGRFFKHSYIYAIGNVLNRIGAFLLLPVYTNYLSPLEYGALELFYGVSAVIFGFLSIGIAHATLRFYFDYDEQKQRHLVVSTNYIAAILISLAGAGLVSIWNNEISMAVFSSEIYADGIFIILGTIVFELSSQVCLAYVRAIEKSLFFVYIALAKLLIQVGLNIYFVMFAEMGVIGILLGNFLAVFVGWLILSQFTLSKCGFGFDIEKLTKILKYSLPFLLGTITGLVSANVDKFTLNYVDTLSAVGIYMLARKFSMIIEQLIGEPFSRSYGSFRFSIMKNPNASSIQANITKYLFYTTLFVALGICLFIEDLLLIISSEEFRPAATFVPLIMISSLIKILNYPVQTGVLYEKKTKYFFYIGAVGALISVVGNLSLIPLIGIYGACLTLIVADSVCIVLMHSKSQKYFKVSYDYSKMIYAFLLAVGLYLISTLIETESIFISLLYKSILALVYCVGIFKSNLFLNQEEKLKVNTFVGSKLSFLRP